jgi:AraC-like DNA-binding protein
VFPGVRLTYNDLHLSQITGHDDMTTASGVEVLVINHCREGRFECEFAWGECGYLGNGDMSVSTMPPPMKNSCFPLAHYHGVSILFDIAHFTEHLGRALDALEIPHIDISGIKTKLLQSSPFFVMRGSEALSHIFSELYNAPDNLKESYIRLKLIELLLLLSIIEPKDTDTRKYFYKTRVEAVKAMREHMTSHLEQQFTLEDLSNRWNIPLTSMKSCFKSVFGAPIHIYMRNYRMQAASELLRSTDESVATIAEKVGYDSHAQFSAAFKTVLGSTPSDYRKSLSKMNHTRPNSITLVGESVL